MGASYSCPSGPPISDARQSWGGGATFISSSMGTASGGKANVPQMSQTYAHLSGTNSVTIIVNLTSSGFALPGATGAARY
jgi:hypothetical protein